MRDHVFNVSSIAETRGVAESIFKQVSEHPFFSSLGSPHIWRSVYDIDATIPFLAQIHKCYTALCVAWNREPHFPGGLSLDGIKSMNLSDFLHVYAQYRMMRLDSFLEEMEKDPALKADLQEKLEGAIDCNAWEELPQIIQEIREKKTPEEALFYFTEAFDLANLSNRIHAMGILLPHAANINFSQILSEKFDLYGRIDIDMLRFLLAAGANPNFISPNCAVSQRTPLHHVCRSSYADGNHVRALIAAGANVDPRDFCGETPLHEALNHGNIEAALVLIQSGADVNARCMVGRSVLHRAISLGSEEVIRALLDARVDLTELSEDKLGRFILPQLTNEEHDNNLIGQLCSRVPPD